MMFWEFQQLEIHFPRASVQLGFSRVFFDRRSATDHLDAGLRSSHATLVRR